MDILKKIETATPADAHEWRISPDPDAFCIEWLGVHDRPPPIPELAVAVLEAHFDDLIYYQNK